MNQLLRRQVRNQFPGLIGWVGHPAFKKLTSYLDCEGFTFYDANQCYQKAWKRVLRKLEEEKPNPQR